VNHGRLADLATGAGSPELLALPVRTVVSGHFRPAACSPFSPDETSVGHLWLAFTRAPELALDIGSTRARGAVPPRTHSRYPRIAREVGDGPAAGCCAICALSAGHVEYRVDLIGVDVRDQLASLFCWDGD
jgi:hypothetical protein